MHAAPTEPGARPAAVLEGLGTALPNRLVSNDMLAGVLPTSDEWIRTRTGIRQRYHVDQGTATSDLAVEAGERALKSVGIEQVDLVVLATTTPDHPCPATAPEVASRLGMSQVAAFDIAAVCTGFVYGLAIASSAIVGGLADRVLLIGAETYSSILDTRDRATSVVFGDGAGAVVLRRGVSTEPGALLGFDLGSDGRFADLITIPGGGSRQRSGGAPVDPAATYFRMQGKAVFTQAVTHMAESARTMLDRLEWTVDSVGWFVGHQANIRILHAVADQLRLPRERALVNVDRVANTSAASIPLAMADGVTDAQLRPGDRVLVTAFGGGLTWGSAGLVWPDIQVG